MNGDTHAEIRRYLAAVDQAAFALPADRRNQLVDDLAARITVALAERPGVVTAILAELGDPHDIAATALHESGTLSEALRHHRDPQLVVTL